jgi:hypothetical protein
MTSAYTLKRTGLRPLSFEGELLSEADSRQTQGPCENRWWSLELYRTGERYIISVSYRTQWQGEHDTDTVVVLDTPKAIEEWLHEFPHLAGISGYPRGHEERQARLEQSLRQCWEAAVTELLAVLGPEQLGENPSQAIYYLATEQNPLGVIAALLGDKVMIIDLRAGTYRLDDAQEVDDEGRDWKAHLEARVAYGEAILIRPVARAG